MDAWIIQCLLQKRTFCHHFHKPWVFPQHPCIDISSANIQSEWDFMKRKTHHYEVPHARGFGHQCGHRAAAWHQDDLYGLRVQQVIQQLRGLTRITLKAERKTLLNISSIFRFEAQLSLFMRHPVTPRSKLHTSTKKQQHFFKKYIHSPLQYTDPHRERDYILYWIT